MSLRWKIVLPFLILVLLLSLGMALLVSRQQSRAEEVRFLRQLRDAGQQAVDELVRQEARLLDVERAIANTEGVPEAAALSDAEALRARVLQILVNSGMDMAVVLNREGVSILSLRRPTPDAPPGEISALRGEGFYRDWIFVQNVLALAGRTPVGDGQGEKQAGLASIRLGEQDVPVLFVAGPLLDDQGTHFGAVLVGMYLENLVDALQDVAGAHLTLYDPSGAFLATDLEVEGGASGLAAGLDPSLVEAVRVEGPSSAPYRSFKHAGQSYGELLVPFQVRNGTVDLGVMGVSLLGGEGQEAIESQYQAQLRTIWLLGGVAAALVLGTGLLVSRWVMGPVEALERATLAVAEGKEETIEGIESRDEVGELAQAMYRLVSNLRQEAQYRDLITQTVTPEARKFLRETLAAGGDWLEGHKTRGAVMYLRLGVPQDQEAPTVVLESLEALLGAVIPIINRHGGMVDVVSGDVLRALYGVFPRPLPPAVSALQATHAGLEIVAFGQAINEARAAEGLPPLDVGIGLATGWVIAGAIGTTGRLQFTAVGDTVQVAQRLLQATKSMPGETFLISEAAYEHLGQARPHLRFGRYGRLHMETEDREVGVYEVRGREFRLVDCSDLYPPGAGA